MPRIESGLLGPVALLIAANWGWQMEIRDKGFGMNIMHVAMVMLSACCLGADGRAEDAVRDRGGDAALLRVMTFNIRYGTANDGENHWDKRKDLVVGVLRDHAPDIVGLQEALRFQTDYIRAALPHYREIGVGRDDGMEQGEYTPLLYDARRFHVGESGTFWLSGTPDIPGSRHWGNSIPRICTWGRFIDRRRGTAFYVYNTHLDHIAQESREKGVRVIADRVARRPHPDPVVLTGDMNAQDDNPAIRYLLGENRDKQKADLPAFLDAHRLCNPESENESTWSGWTGQIKGRKIDYIFVLDGKPTVEVLKAAILRDNDNGRYPSDHYPVAAVLRFPPAGE